MQIRDLRSIIVIALFVFLNLFILTSSFLHRVEKEQAVKKRTNFAPEYSIVESLDYFYAKDGIPQMSLTAAKLKSEGEVFAEFDEPRGVYNYQQKKQTIKYVADRAIYKKKKNHLKLISNAKITSDEGIYTADTIDYFINDDLVLGHGNVLFEGDDLKSRDHLVIRSESMKAYPEKKYGLFTTKVNGTFARFKKYEGKLFFWSELLEFKGMDSFVHLEDQVKVIRDNYTVTSGKADIYLENYNKSLKYFFLNDDVKVLEKLATPGGVVERRSFSEQLEGFGQEEKMILSGAPRVETGNEVVKGYRITIRQKAELIEVDDAVSDMLMKKNKKKE